MSLGRGPFPKLDKVEFVYKYREEFARLEDRSWFPRPSKHPLYHVIRYLAIRARHEIGYAKSNCHADVVWMLFKHYKKLKEQGFV